MRTHFTTALQNIMPTHISHLTVWRVITVLLIALASASATATTGQVGDRDMTLNCEFTQYGNSGAATKLTKGWIPSNQTHHITGDEVVFESYYKKLRGKVTKRNDERIEWTYQERAKDRKGRRFGATRHYSYFFTTKKVASKMGFKVYRDFEYVWGTCKAKPKKTNTSTKRSKTDSQKRDEKYKPFLPINVNDWRTIRGSNGSVLKYHNKHDAILFTSANSWFGTAHAKLARAPKTDLRYAIYWANENVFNLKGSKHFNYNKPDGIVATTYKGIKYIMVLDSELDRIHDNKKTFMQISMRFEDSGEWLSHNTTLK